MKKLRVSEYQIVFFGSPLEAKLFESFFTHFEEEFTRSFPSSRKDFVVLGSRADIRWFRLVTFCFIRGLPVFRFDKWGLLPVSRKTIFREWFAYSLMRPFIPLLSVLVYLRTLAFLVLLILFKK